MDGINGRDGKFRGASRNKAWFNDGVRFISGCMGIGGSLTLLDD